MSTAGADPGADAGGDVDPVTGVADAGAARRPDGSTAKADASIVTGAPVRTDCSHASARTRLTTPSPAGEGFSARPATTSRKTATSRAYAGAYRSWKPVYASSPGSMPPGSRLRSGVRAS